MAKSKGGGNRGRARSPVKNAPSTTGNKSGGKRGNAPAKGGKSSTKGKK